MLVKERRPKQAKLPATALDEQQRKLDEESRKLREQVERYEKLLANAPAIKKAGERRKREELLNNRAKGVVAPAFSRTALPDPRYRHEQLRVGTASRQPRLRGERSQGKVMFFILLIAFIAMLGWVWTTFSRG